MQSDMIEREDPLFAVFGQDLRRVYFQDFSVAVRSFTAHGSLLQPTGECKYNTSHVHFRSVNLYKEFSYRSKSE